MASARLSPLDASFLEVESTSAHMHVGWVATFAPPADGRRPSFAQLRDHIARRLSRAPRYRQRLADVPLGLNAPTWVDDETFDVRNHVLHTTSRDLVEVADMVYSVPLNRSRPLWELWVADRLADGRVGIVGKAHHCLVDGIAAVELASLLLDPEPDPPEPDDDGWHPAPAPSRLERLAGGVRDRTAEQLDLLTLPVRLARRPERVRALVAEARRAAAALADTVDPAPDAPVLNDPITPLRHLSLVSRELEELRRVKRHFGVTLNDVVLAVCAGGMREFLDARGEAPLALKTMVPVNVRGDVANGDLGNRISFVFVDLPCDETDPVVRLRRVHEEMEQCKASGLPRGGDAVLRSLGLAPRSLQNVVSRLAASPLAYNLTISNIPGPAAPLWMRGCRLERAHPAIPLSDRHALSIGLTTVGEGAHFGIYADRRVGPDAELLGAQIGGALDELLALAG